MSPLAARARADDRGGAALWAVIVVAAIAGAALAGLAGVAPTVVDANRARTAADAVALAGAEHGRDRAERVAAANGARIVSWTESAGGAGGRTVTVEVVVGETTARARATTVP